MRSSLFIFFFSLFFFNDTATTEIYTLSLHDALPIWLLTLYFPDNLSDDALDVAAIMEEKREEIERAENFLKDVAMGNGQAEGLKEEEEEDSGFRDRWIHIRVISISLYIGLLKILSLPHSAPTHSQIGRASCRERV